MKCKANSVIRFSALSLIIWATNVSPTPAVELTNSTVTASDSSNTSAAFSSAAEALGLMMQVVGNLEEKVQNKDLTSLHSEDLILGASLTAIIQQTNRMELAGRENFNGDVTQFARQVAALHFAGDTQQQDLAEKQFRLVREAFERITQHFPPKTVASAQAAASQYLCPAHRDVRGQKTDFCPKCGAPMNQLVRLLPAYCGFPTAARQSVRATVRISKPLAVGEPVNAYLRLSKTDGSPVYPYDLITAHTERIHLLIIDSSLSDYHHEHPRPTSVAGEYAFSFTPRKAGGYFVWADLRPEPLGLQEYATTVISALVPAEPLTDRTVNHKVTVDGLNYELTFATDQLTVDRPIPGRLRITQADGTPFAQLEPFMAAFAHLVGFNEDCKTVLHIHPKGPPALNPKERGGPELEFQLYTHKPGFVRLFAQVQIGGASKFAPFGIQIVR